MSALDSSAPSAKAICVTRRMGVVTIHTGIRGDADAPIAWNFDPHMVARVTFTPVDVADMAEDAMGDGMH